MNNLNFECPKEGVQLDLPLIHDVLVQAFFVAPGAKATMQRQIANSGGAIPVLTVKPFGIIPWVKFYSWEGHDLPARTVPLHMYILATLTERR